MQNFILSIVEVLGKFIGLLSLPRPIRKLVDSEREFFNSDLLGCVVLTKQNWQLSNLIISGYWEHAALIVSDGCVIEATNRGVIKRNIPECLSDKDDYIILKPLFASAEERQKAIHYADTLVGDEYDYSFSKGNNRWYCSEIIWASYDKALEENPFTPRSIEYFGAKVEVVEPNDFYKANKKWAVIFRKPV